MEVDVRPPQPFDVAISGIFIVGHAGDRAYFCSGLTWMRKSTTSKYSEKHLPRGFWQWSS